MGTRWRIGGLLCLGITVLTSCAAPQSSLKPVLHEEYVIPPSDDPRFSMPPQYPKETMDSGQPKKDSLKGGDQFRGGPNAGKFGAGPGMGGY
jgi:hypothetical protein